MPELVIKLPAGQVAVLSSLKLKSLGGAKTFDVFGPPCEPPLGQGGGVCLCIGLGL